MPIINIAPTDAELAELEARSASANLSLRSFIRAELTRGIDGPDLAAELADHEERLARLEELVVAVGLSA